MPGGTEDDLLGRDGGVGNEVVVGGDDLVDVDEVFGLCWLSCACVHGAQCVTCHWLNQPVSLCETLSDMEPPSSPTRKMPGKGDYEPILSVKYWAIVFHYL